MGVFAEWQGRYAAVGIATVPVDPDKKVPLVSHWQKFGLPGSTALTRKFEDCNGIAFRCGGRNGITILDIDLPDEHLLRQALERHGDTPLIERTASGKYHAWYRHNGESRSIKRLWGKNVPIDLLGGGLSIAAPSTRSDGTAYQFIRGGLDYVPNLPTMRGLEAIQKVQPQSVTPAGSADLPNNKSVREGERNYTLFRACLKYAIQAANIHELMERAMAMNAQFNPPLSEAEAMGCALNAWRYHDRKRNFLISRSFVLPADALDKFDTGDGGDAILLLFRIERAHWNRDQFVLAQAFAETLGWTIKRFLKARAMLVGAGLIVQLTPGGRLKGDAPLFAWPTTGPAKAA